MIQLFSNEYAQIHLDEELPCLHVCTLNLPKSSEQLRKAMLALISVSEQYYRKYRLNGILSDTSQAAGAVSEDLEWVANQVVPRLAEAGVRKMAIINPQLALGQHSMDEYLQLTVGKLEQRVFPSNKEAEEWLRKG